MCLLLSSLFCIIGTKLAKKIQNILKKMKALKEDLYERKSRRFLGRKTQFHKCISLVEIKNSQGGKKKEHKQEQVLPAITIYNKVVVCN